MEPAVAHIPNWQETQTRLANRSAKEEFFDSINVAAYHFAKAMEEKAKQWESACMSEKAKKEYLLAVLIQNGINVPDLSLGIPPIVPICPNKKNSLKFSDLIQEKNKNDILLRLHNCIDGKGGKDVAAVLLRAKDDKLISRLPNEKEFRSEFTNITSKWRAISTYLNPNNLADYSSVKI